MPAWLWLSPAPPLPPLPATELTDPALLPPTAALPATPEGEPPLPPPAGPGCEFAGPSLLQASRLQPPRSNTPEVARLIEEDRLKILVTW